MSSSSSLKFALVLFILYFKCLFLSIESQTSSLVTDKEALLSFKSQITTSGPLNPLSQWEPNLSPCNWTGVVCNGRRTRVVALNLSGLHLQGSISPHIGNLSFLRSLLLQENQLSGPLPDQMGNLFRLRELNLSQNSLNGVLPSNISKLTELRVLDLTTNRITGAIPTDLDRLVNLQVLNLGKNLFTGTIPASIANITSLDTLSLGTNNLTGTIPTELSRLGKLTVLDLTINHLTGTVPASIYNMSSLVVLALASNHLWGRLPYDVGVTLPNLLVFNFCFNQFTGGIPGSLHNLTNIKVIRMAQNRLVGTVPPGLGNLPFLEMYNIGYNTIVSTGDDDGLQYIITSLTNSSRLKFLALDGNPLGGVIPESVGNLSKVLEKLYMGQSRISGNIPPSIAQLSGLTLLNLSYNSISGEIPPEMGKLVELQVLDLARNQISGRIPSNLGDLQQLNHIDLSGNQLVGQIPSNFQNFQKLLSMDLSNNRLNGSIPREILNLPSLSTVLNLSKNSLDGPIPEEIGILKSVVAIDLSMNHLSGNIPSSIKDCISLEELSMAYNMLSGPVPGAIGEPSNILLDEDMTAKVGDFGLARLLMEKSSDQPSISSTNALKGSVGYIPPEYGLGGKASTAGDVYSFGVMLLELFTGKNPTHESFVGELSLIKWTQSAFPSNVNQILDPELLLLQHDTNGQPINPDTYHDCLTTIIGVGISCSSVSPDGRITMRDALRKLKTVKNTLTNRSPPTEKERGSFNPSYKL
ncbi:hypothetical protein V6N13_129771 [Hibiscus sabdariffa]|uniref:Protein kinase domain-containing protein n=1 Tax=Hibiscus sabdariffa TaxID=183260 RepID=A0ABR2SMV5_9ROSI